MWAHLVSAALGLWLMVAPALITTYSEQASTNNRIIGPLVFTFAVVSLWEITRSVRFGNTLLGAWLVIACLLLDYQGLALASNLVSGILILGLSLVRGEHRPERFGGGWMSLWNEKMWKKGQHDETI